MPLLGKGAVAMWWSVHLDQRVEFGDWHSHEHLPERLRIPGFLRGSRWASTADDGGFFVLYELDEYETLTSREYLQRLNNPTSWSTKMMPYHLGMVRSQCRVVASYGGGLAGSVVTIRLSPGERDRESLAHRLGELISRLPDQPGLTGVHLLKTQTPYHAAVTTEQKIRGGDEAADWILLLFGYDRAAMTAAVAGQLSYADLQAYGVGPAPTVDGFRLSFALTAGDIAVPARVVEDTSALE